MTLLPHLPHRLRLPPSTTSAPLTTIRATINHLRSTATPATTTATPTTTAPSDLLLYSHISPIGSAFHQHPDLLHRYMNYTPTLSRPSDLPLAESLLLRASSTHSLAAAASLSFPSSSRLGPNDLKALSSSNNNTAVGNKDEEVGKWVARLGSQIRGLEYGGD
ncbi:hypothetical protein Syun_002237 [Stephania yunnanensis]|uniref:Uncharacterized protein n=1 Tax=Stephania yunnanensis TaxID=152371 RepID=A0AAP0LF15_9MAGN